MNIRERLEHLGDTPRGRRILRVVRMVFTIGIIVFLIWELRTVEFRQVLQGLPKNPGFLRAIGRAVLSFTHNTDTGLQICVGFSSRGGH